MKLIPYIPACHEAGWPLATVTLRITVKSHEVDAMQATTMTIALPQWLVEDGEANADYLDDDGILIRNTETVELYSGWTEPIAPHCSEAGFYSDGGLARVVEVLSIRPD